MLNIFWTLIIFFLGGGGVKNVHENLKKKKGFKYPH